MKTILFGFGQIAPQHLEVLKELNCQVIGIIIRDYEKGVTNAKKFGINKVYRSIDEISENDFDFFTVLVSPENNQTVLEQILKFKKPVFIEKPISFSSKGLDRIIDLNKKFNCPVMIAMNRRFYSVFHSGLKYLQEKGKKIDSIVIEAPERFSDINLPKFSNLVKENWMFANSIHCIDLIRFFGGDIQKIDTNSKPKKFSFSAIGHCSNDVEFTYISNWKSPGSWSITLYSDKIKILYNPLENGIIFENNTKTVIESSEEDKRFKPGFYFQLRHFLENILYSNELKWPSSDLSDHKKTIELIEKIYHRNND